jgi:hypothetical protein
VQEWDKFDVDKELQRLEEEEKQREEFAKFAKKAADPFETVPADGIDSYSLDSMTPLERRMAAKVRARDCPCSLTRVCVCVCACVRACVRACVCVCACVKAMYGRRCGSMVCEWEWVRCESSETRMHTPTCI